nr:DNA internalization-related competence protein ComEC/Rec2 [Panacagrimonas sp.]
MHARVRPAAAGDALRLSLALVAGVLMVHAAATISFPGLVPLAAALALPALVRWPGRASWGAALLGALVALWAGRAYLDDRWPADRHGQMRDVVGHVASLPERAGPADAQTLRFEFEPIDPALPRRLRVSWYRTDATVRGGQCWRMSLRLRTPHGSANPRGFDYEGWLYRRGIGAVATVRDAARCDATRSMPVLRARQALVDAIDGWLATHPSRAMVSALTVGDDAGFSDAQWDVFRRTGTSHLVAISGFNIAILAAVAYVFVRWTWPLSRHLAARWPAQKGAAVAAAFAGLAYGLLAGWESPAQRAALMLGLLLFATLPGRSADPLRGLACALALMLVSAPAAVLSSGMWLSFAAVAAIFYSTTGRLRRAPAWRLALVLQAMLSVLLAPLTLYFFSGAAWLGPLVNLVAVPVMTVLTPLVLAAMAAAWAFGDIGVRALVLVADALHGIETALAWLASSAPAAWLPAAPPLAALALALFGAVMAFAPRGWPLRALAVPCFLPLLWPPQLPVRGPFEITVLDVGQGLSVLVRTRHHVLLYDAGPAFEEGFDAGESVVAPAILGLGRRGIDLLLLSHGDGDHAGGMEAVRRLVRVDAELGTPGSVACRDGQRWRWDGVEFEILHPANGDPDARSDNDRSCVLRVTADGLVALLAGDIEQAAEARLLRDHADQLRADVLIAPHHGSRTSSTEAFVQAVAPSVVVFGAAWRSHFRHPRPEVVDRYVAIGARPLTTGVEGAIRIWRETDGGIGTRSWRREVARFWNAPPEP